MSEYDFTLQTYTFIASNEIVSEIHVEIVVTLQTNMFIASNKCVLCWECTLLALETNMFRAGDEPISTGDKRVQNACVSFNHIHSHTHTQLATSHFQAEFMST